MVDADDK